MAATPSSAPRAAAHCSLCGVPDAGMPKNRRRPAKRPDALGSVACVTAYLCRVRRLLLLPSVATWSLAISAASSRLRAPLRLLCVTVCSGAAFVPAAAIYISCDVDDRHPHHRPAGGRSRRRVAHAAFCENGGMRTRRLYLDRGRPSPEARDVVVVIDVLRSFSTAATPLPPVPPDPPGGDGGRGSAQRGLPLRR